MQCKLNYLSQSKPRFTQVQKYYMKKKTRFILTDKLGSNTKKLKKSRWCSNHLAAKPLKTKVSFMYNDKRYTKAFHVYLVLNCSGH